MHIRLICPWYNHWYQVLNESPMTLYSRGIDSMGKCIWRLLIVMGLELQIKIFHLTELSLQSYKGRMARNTCLIAARYVFSPFRYVILDPLCSFLQYYVHSTCMFNIFSSVSKTVILTHINAHTRPLYILGM